MATGSPIPDGPAAVRRGLGPLDELPQHVVHPGLPSRTARTKLLDDVEVRTDRYGFLRPGGTALADRGGDLGQGFGGGSGVLEILVLQFRAVDGVPILTELEENRALLFRWGKRPDCAGAEAR